MRKRRRDVAGPTVREREVRRLLVKQEASGESMPAFCESRGLNPSTMNWWRSELRRRDRRQATGVAAAAAAAVAEPEQPVAEPEPVCSPSPAAGATASVSASKAASAGSSEPTRRTRRSSRRTPSRPAKAPAVTQPADESLPLFVELTARPVERDPGRPPSGGVEVLVGAVQVRRVHVLKGFDPETLAEVVGVLEGM